MYLDGLMPFMKYTKTFCFRSTTTILASHSSNPEKAFHQALVLLLAVKNRAAENDLFGFMLLFDCINTATIAAGIA